MCVCVCLCVYVRRSFYKKNESRLRSWQRESLFRVTPYLRKSIIISPFISQKTVRKIIFIDCCSRNFLYNRE